MTEYKDITFKVRIEGNMTEEQTQYIQDTIEQSVLDMMDSGSFDYIESVFVDIQDGTPKVDNE